MKMQHCSIQNNTSQASNQIKLPVQNIGTALMLSGSAIPYKNISFILCILLGLFFL